MPQVPVLITAVYPAYIEATSVHRKDARWCGCASEFDGMGLPQENLEAGKDVSPARGNFPPVPGKDAATIKRATNLNIDGNGKKGGGAWPNKGPTAKQGHLMAEFMSRRQTLLAQHRSLRVLPANRTASSATDTSSRSDMQLIISDGAGSAPTRFPMIPSSTPRVVAPDHASMNSWL